MSEISDLTNAANMAGQPPSARPVPRPATPGATSPAPTPGTARTAPSPAPAMPTASQSVTPTASKPATPTESQTTNTVPTSQPVRMSQGSEYNAGGNGTAANPIDLDSGSKDKPKFSIKAIGIAVAIGLVFIFLISFLTKLGGSDKQAEESIPTEEIPIDEPVIVEPTNYSPEEIIQLRACGYSLDEMENAFACGISCDDMVAQAMAERQAWIDEAVAPYYDTASDEYKADLAQTWRGLTKYEDTYKYIGASQSLSKTRNLDFEKVDTHGAQLFIKIYLQEEPCAEYFFHLCTIEDWLRLPDEGNIICTYEYTTAYYDDGTGNYVEDFDRIFITNSTIEIFD